MWQRHSQKEFPDNEKEILKSKGSGKYLLDLWRANEIVFMEAGVPKEQIVTTNLCTCCNPKLLFFASGKPWKTRKSWSIFDDKKRTGLRKS